MSEEKVVAFVRERIASVWALELLFVLARDRNRAWRTDELVREMRSSTLAIREALKNLIGIGLAGQDSQGLCRYEPSTRDLEETVSQIQVTYAAKPVTIVKAIGAEPHDKLRMFADAFKLKE